MPCTGEGRQRFTAQDVITNLEDHQAGRNTEVLVKIGTKEVAWWVRGPTLLLKDPDSIPSTYIMWLSTICYCFLGIGCFDLHEYQTHE